MPDQWKITFFKVTKLAQNICKSQYFSSKWKNNETFQLARSAFTFQVEIFSEFGQAKVDSKNWKVNENTFSEFEKGQEIFEDELENEPKISFRMW